MRPNNRGLNSHYLRLINNHEITKILVIPGNNEHGYFCKKCEIHIRASRNPIGPHRCDYYRD